MIEPAKFRPKALPVRVRAARADDARSVSGAVRRPAPSQVHESILLRTDVCSSLLFGMPNTLFTISPYV